MFFKIFRFIYLISLLLILYQLARLSIRAKKRRLLLLYPAKLDASMIIENNIEAASKAIEQGADIEKIGNHRYTPLQLAATYGHIEMVKFLLQQGAHINQQDSEGLTALHHAIWARQGHVKDMVNLLLSHGIDIHARTRQGLTALEIAKLVGLIEIVVLLKKKGS